MATQENSQVKKEDKEKYWELVTLYLWAYLRYEYSKAQEEVKKFRTELGKSTLIYHESPIKIAHDIAGLEYEGI
jgi:hypothetical protein